DVACRLPLEPPARLNPIEVAVDVELHQHRRMIGRPTGRFRIDPAEPRSPRSSSSTKNSITRTGLSSTIKSSRHSENSVTCPRSTPSMKRFIRSPQATRESYRANQMRWPGFHTARTHSGHSLIVYQSPLLT